MPLSDEDEQAIDRALRAWRQGDVSLDAGLEFLHLADLSHPLRPASMQVAEAFAEEGEAIEADATPVLDKVQGMVMLSQTCDIVRNCRAQPFVEIAPLVAVSESWLEEIRRLKRPAFAQVPATAGDRLVADLDRTMTVEKAIVARWTRLPGWETDEEIRAFAQALARKRSRFAFPDDFVAAASSLQAHMVARYNRRTDEGAHLRALREIRVRAAPSWDDDEVQLTWWFIKDGDPAEEPPTGRASSNGGLPCSTGPAGSTSIYPTPAGWRTWRRATTSRATGSTSTACLSPETRPKRTGPRLFKTAHACASIDGGDQVVSNSAQTGIALSCASTMRMGPVPSGSPELMPRRERHDGKGGQTGRTEGRHTGRSTGAARCSPKASGQQSNGVAAALRSAGHRQSTLRRLCSLLLRSGHAESDPAFAEDPPGAGSSVVEFTLQHADVDAERVWKGHHPAMCSVEHMKLTAIT